MIDENQLLLATDSYGLSKIAAEKLVADWCIALNIDYYILRLPLIAAPNAPGNLGAMVSAIRAGRYYSIGQAGARKSMVLACDVAMLIAGIKGTRGCYNLTDGHHPSFRELENYIAQFHGKNKPFAIPIMLAKAFALGGNLMGRRAPINSTKLKKITSTLTFSDSKARQLLQWQSTPILKGWQAG